MALTAVLVSLPPAAAQDGAQTELPSADPRTVVGAPAGRPLSGAELERRTHDVAALLRCPVCQGLSVADSPAETAVSMKHQVREMLAQGYSRDQVVAYFERSYGEFVRLEPALRGVNWLVWLAPLLGLLAGGFVVVRLLRAPRALPSPSGSGVAGEGESRSARDPDAPGPDTLPDDPDLAPYVLRARELAYGWPGGVRPRPEP